MHYVHRVSAGEKAFASKHVFHLNLGTTATFTSLQRHFLGLPLGSDVAPVLKLKAKSFFLLLKAFRSTYF